MKYLRLLNKKKILIPALSILLTFIAIAATSYSFFFVSAPSTSVGMTGTSATIGDLVYTGTALNFSGKPGDTSSTTISMKNQNGTLGLKYGLKLVVLANEFVATDQTGGDIVVKVNTTNGCTLSNSELTLGNIVSTTNYVIVNESSCTIGANLTHTYTVNVEFKDTISDQFENQNKTFSAYIEPIVPEEQ